MFKSFWGGSRGATESRFQRKIPGCWSHLSSRAALGAEVLNAPMRASEKRCAHSSMMVLELAAAIDVVVLSPSKFNCRPNCNEITMK